jgi:hypothetical protein
MIIKQFFYAILLITAFSQCVDRDIALDIEGPEYDLAVPLINSRITIGRVAAESKGNTSIRIDSDGKATVAYNGDVIRRTAAAIFPPFPGILDNPIPDTLYDLPLPFGSPSNIFLIDRATFRNTRIFFEFEHDQPEDVQIRMQILNLKRNNQHFDQRYTLKYNGNFPNKIITPQFSIDGWELVSNTNAIRFYYEAVRPNGEKVRLKNAILRFDLILFSYIEGYLGYHIFGVDGNAIRIGLFNAWKSGGFNFEDPKIVLRVDNAFGLPVRSRVNKMQLTTVTGNVLSLESPFINTGIDFDYPGFNEVGKTKSTFFTFDKNNSNIREIFNEKTNLISYDIDALVNPDRDTTIKGYIDFDAFFNINVAAEVPLNGYVRELVVSDTLSLDLSAFNSVHSGEFKIITANDFPAEVSLQIYFLDAEGRRLEELFAAEGLVLPAAVLLPNGRTQRGQERTTFVPLSQSKLENMRKSDRVLIEGRLNTTGSAEGKSLWLYDDYGITVKAGALLKYKK